MTKKDCRWEVNNPNYQKQDISSILIGQLVVILDPTLPHFYTKIT
jgi:hypothetical protein